jgi:hypothetical protein
MAKRLVSNLTDIQSVAEYLRRIGADQRSLRTAVVKKMQGSYWKDIAIIRIGRDGEVKATVGFEPTDVEAKSIKDEFDTIEFPTLQKLANLRGSDLPEQIKSAYPDDIFEFRDVDNQIVMVQLRMTVPSGKIYIPWTYYSDGIWRSMEPEGSLPLWGLEALGDNSTVFIHEGAKAARIVRTMVEGRTPQEKTKCALHPWGRELSGAAHLGWIGGALSPSRTDWSALRKAGVRRVYVVTDNDAAGLSAMPSISYALDLPTFHVQFTSEWPASFDLGDDFPKAMFATLAGEKRYIGPAFRDCLHPATWATELKPNPSGKGKPVTILRDSFKDLWAYIEEADAFVCVEMPEIMRTEAVLNKQLAPFSHVSETSRLIVRAFRGRTARLCYRPDVLGRVVTDRGSSAINLHVPPTIRASSGDPKPFEDFLDYLFPVAEERHKAARWCATLIARPDIRMHYGLLLVTEHQGIGKTTLGSSILAPLVGVHNVGWPSESDVATSQFNGWLANKRLLVVNEIYSGHSWKAYNNLKSMITDTELEVNQKYQRTYTVENWAHIIACSNSARALRMEEDDRRWFYPHMTEVAWSIPQFVELRKWLGSGGLSIVKHWAEKFGDYVKSGERAPSTSRKQELISASRSEGASEAAQLGEALASFDRGAALSMKDVVAHVRGSVQGKLFESDYEMRKAMMEVGCFVWPERLKIGGRLQYMVLNKHGMHTVESIAASEDAERNNALRSLLVKSTDIFEREM